MATVLSPIGRARRHLRVMVRRLDHLKERSDGHPELHYTRSEIAALEWAIRELTPLAGNGFNPRAKKLETGVA